MFVKIIVLLFLSLSAHSIGANDEIIYFGKGTVSIPLKSNDYTYLKFERPILEFPGRTDLEVIKVGDNNSTKVLRIKPLSPDLRIDSVFILNDATAVNISLYVDKEGFLAKKSYSLIQDQSLKNSFKKDEGFNLDPYILRTHLHG